MEYLLYQQVKGLLVFGHYERMQKAKVGDSLETEEGEGLSL
jgi:hypothetical protein